MQVEQAVVTSYLKYSILSQATTVYLVPKDRHNSAHNVHQSFFKSNVASKHCCCWGRSSRPPPGVFGAIMLLDGAGVAPRRQGLLLLFRFLFMYMLLWAAVAVLGAGCCGEKEQGAGVFLRKSSTEDKKLSSPMLLSLDDVITWGKTNPHVDYCTDEKQQYSF